MRQIGKQRFCAVLCGALLALGWAVNAFGFKITFVHTSDVHAHYESFDKNGDNTGFSKGFGGSPRIAAFIEQVRAQYANVVAVDTGDQFDKSTYFAKYGPSLVNANLKALRYNFFALGNHEFARGAKGFRQLVHNLNIPVLCANIDFKKHIWLAEYVKPWAIMELDGEKVGFIGAVTGPDRNLLNPPEIDSFDPKPCIEQAVAELCAKGVNKIVLLSHCGYKTDLELARDVSGLDVILGGHSHLLFSNSEPGADINQYPVVVDTDGGRVLVAHSGYYGKYAGLLHVKFDDAGHVTDFGGDSVLMDKSIKPLARVTTLFEPYKALLDAEEDVAIGYSAMFFDGRETTVRFGESALANLVTNIILNYGKDYNAEIALVNAGSITGSINAGPVKIKDVKDALYYDNQLVTVKIAGRDIWDALEHGLAEAHDLKGDMTGRLLQPAGLRYTANLAQPVGRRLISVEVLGPQGFADLEPGRFYNLITLDFLAGGGDGHMALYTGARDLRRLAINSRQVVMDYFEDCSPVIGGLDGRVNLLNRASE